MFHHEIICASCQYTWTRPMYASANVTRNPGLKARIISGDLFSVQCPSCEHTNDVHHDCLYHDSQKRLMISLTDTPDPEKRAQAVTAELRGARLDAYTLRIVQSAQDLREKVFIFDSGLNDGIVEACKRILSEQDPELQDASLRFLFVDCAGHLTFAIIRPGRQTRNVSVPRAYYDAARTKAFSDLAAYADEHGTWVCMDSEAVSLQMKRKAS